MRTLGILATKARSDVAKPGRASTDKLKAPNALPECDRPRGSYIYLLEDSRTGAAFYVGKGKSLRYRAHIKEACAGFGHNLPKLNRIRQIEAAGAKVIHRRKRVRRLEHRCSLCALRLRLHCIARFDPIATVLVSSGRRSTQGIDGEALTQRLGQQEHGYGGEIDRARGLAWEVGR